MANQQAYNVHMQNKGTLVPGQSIVVNKFTVQVERYLSQGGFAHVYLVRTATPVYNTTHHVLKRIAVANESMLAEVKKEVDVMRLLKGHPNIVHLIDAAWHQMPNGTYEVFILMEFCPGGGIIDMMNRRLRERLTEAEILQIFVDVCEGVACMHNLRPALLHRDLKVENILQSTSTSYKLCDFGSATTVTRPPATTQEIRALEADLNRHTTLQYRAPEMVDVYSRRPVDEKSDVWALGVLLYKLCYYTTPFEEHGQLAILNVQYKIPPYPVYSPQMNQLIATMLQEHGVRRPSIFEILAHVHRLRGTKSRFKYTIPEPQPLSPRHQTTLKPSPSLAPIHNEHISVPQSNRIRMSVSPSRGQGIQAREKVMEAIAPPRKDDHARPNELKPSRTSPNIQQTSNSQFMRRGRPPHKESEAAAPKSINAQTSEPGDGKDWLRAGFSPGGDVWAADKPHSDASTTDLWPVGGKELRSHETKDANIGFGDDFESKIWRSAGENSSSQTNSNLALNKTSALSQSRLQQPLGINRRPSPARDAFDGLGLGTSYERPAPTLAEARKLRTGLAIMHSNGFRTNPDRPGVTAPRPSPSPRQPITPQLQLYPSSVASPSPITQNNPLPRLGPQSAASKDTSLSLTDGISAESRFPSLEELDSGISLQIPSESSAMSSLHRSEESVSLTRRNGIIQRPGASDANLLTPGSHSRGFHAREGTRSEQVTGIAMREPQGTGGGSRFNKTLVDLTQEENKMTIGVPPRQESNLSSRPALSRKNRSFTSMDVSNDSSNANTSPRVTQDAVPRSPLRKKPKDWLTGEDDADDFSDAPPTSIVSPAPPETPVIRESPSKRASVIQRSVIPVQVSAVAELGHIRRAPSPPPEVSPTLTKFTRSFPPIDRLDILPTETVGKEAKVVKRAVERPRDDNPTSSGDDEPEDAVGIIYARRVQTEKRGHKGRQSSVHDLVDLYGGGLGLSQKEKERDTYTARPLQSASNSMTQAVKGRPTAPAKLSPNIVPTSSNNLLPPLSTNAYDRSTSNDQHSTPTSGPTPSPSRSRPQSMFIFPSKSIDTPSSPGQPLPSPGLAPPDNTRHRNVRRTSISDIVQRYEGISGVSRPTALLSSTAPRPVVNLPGLATNDARSPKRPSNSEKERSTSTLPVPAGDYVPSRRSKSPTEVQVTTPTPVIGRPVPIRHHTLQKEMDDLPRIMTLKSEPIRVPKFPAQGTTADDLTIRGGSSSPERPYQGVGKLIDQWQKKTAEADSRTVLKGRGTFTAKPPT